MNEDVAQKNMSFHSGTKMQLGSLCQPGSIGFVKDESRVPGKEKHFSAMRLAASSSVFGVHIKVDLLDLPYRCLTYGGLLECVRGRESLHLRRRLAS